LHQARGDQQADRRRQPRGDAREREASSDVVEGLTVDRGWSGDQLARHLGALLRSTFVERSHQKGASP
jgi:hypothetical protein